MKQVIIVLDILFSTRVNELCLRHKMDVSRVSAAALDIGRVLE